MRIHILVPRQKKIPSLKKKKRERETWRRCDENVGIGEGNKGKEGWHEPWFLGPVSCSGQISGLKIPERRRCIENLGKSHTCTQTTEGANQTGKRDVSDLTVGWGLGGKWTSMQIFLRTSDMKGLLSSDAVEGVIFYPSSFTEIQQTYSTIWL